MPSEILNKGPEKSDRILGDEWKNWDGNNSESREINENKTTFFVFLLITIVLTILFSWFVLYLISPRLESVGSIFYYSVSAAVILGNAVLLIWYISLGLGIAFGRGFIITGNFNTKILRAIVDKTTSIGLKFGISGDRMANSFLKVFNTATFQSNRKSRPLKPLLILPRCLEKNSREIAKELAQKYGLESYIVGGGEAAKAKIREKNPEAIIGVACERDLLNGIREVSASIPVVGLPNKRPQGPCKETVIDSNDLESAIKHFLKL